MKDGFCRQHGEYAMLLVEVVVILLVIVWAGRRAVRRPVCIPGARRQAMFSTNAIIYYLFFGEFSYGIELIRYFAIDIFLWGAKIG